MRIFGVRVDEMGMEEALRRLEGAAEGGPMLVVSINPEILMYARQDPGYRAALNRATLNIPDGVGILVAAHFRDVRLAERVPGIDLAQRFLAQGRRSVYLFGGLPGVAEAAGRYLTRLNPELRVVGTAHGFQDGEGERRVLGEIRALAPEVLLVGLGFPRQEEWLDRHRAELPVRVAMAVGGSFDIWSGRKRRAPPLVRRAGFEWAYRLVTEPRRLRRMLVLPLFLWHALHEDARSGVEG
jgi:N-acetylglucosaminyldiphosphoundecaprenol N-acetyl-beta-D-mannosaminyltransferase